MYVFILQYYTHTLCDDILIIFYYSNVNKYIYKSVNIVKVNNIRTFLRDVIYIYRFCVHVFKVNKCELYNDFYFKSFIVFCFFIFSNH